MKLKPLAVDPAGNWFNLALLLVSYVKITKHKYTYSPVLTPPPPTPFGKVRKKNFPNSTEGSFSEVLTGERPIGGRIIMRVISEENQEEISESAEGINLPLMPKPP